MYDLIIKNGMVIDGTGGPAFSADVAVHQGKIARIGKDLGDAAQVIDAAGLVVTLGFIDSHSHSDNTILDFPKQVEKAEQGVTTSVGGQCGISPAFAPDKIADQADFKDQSKRAVGLNYVLIAGEVVVEDAVYNGKLPGK